MASEFVETEKIFRHVFHDDHGGDMKRLMVLSAVALLAGCAKPGATQSGADALSASTTPGNGAPSDGAGKACAKAVEDVQDPFETFGKVLVSNGQFQNSASHYQQLSASDLSVLSDPSHGPFLAAKAAGGVAIAAGTELTVTLRENCHGPSEISRTIAAQEADGADHFMSSHVATPSGVRAYTYAVPSDTDTKAIEAQSEADSCIVGISDSAKSFATDLDVSEETAAPMAAADPLIATQRHLKSLGDDEAMSKLFPQGVPGKPVVIAIIDTGIDMSHEDLKDSLWNNTKEIPGNGKDDDGNGYVDDVNGYNFASKIPSPNYQGKWGGYHHGTHVSGLAAARAGNGKGGSGVMGNGVQIMMLNVFGSTAGASTSAIVNAIRYAADNGADVINLSIGGMGRSAAYESALVYAVKKGATVFAASGNEHRSVGPDYFMVPGAYAQGIPGMLSVASVDSESSGISTFSNYSSTYVEIGAPGSENSSARTGLLSTMPGNKYARAQGTSMASPVAAGAGAMAIAAIRARGYQPTPATIEAVMENSGRVEDPLKEKIRGGRVLNLKSMADYISQNFPPGGTGGPANSSNCSTGANL
jgi:hypothetical protein